MQNTLKKLTIFLQLILPCILLGQVTGVVTDTDGMPLPYVNIFVEGTTQGTATNIEGQYNLAIPSGSTLVYKYIGYEEIKKLTQSETEVIDIILNLQAISTEEIVIAADAEDPAYPIIRKAIAKREYYKNQVDKYTVDAYAKGLVKMLKAPEKILGQEIGDMGGMLDTTGQGIVYLSESQSKIYSMKPELKEVMHSSIVSGSDGAFNINRLSNIQFDIYEEYFSFSRTVINPLADNALTYYKYRLEGVTYDEEGREINKIAVIPKSENRPVSFGYIYIVEDSWNVVQLDLKLSGKALKEPIFDTISMRQQFLPVGDEGVWRLFSQEMGFTAGGFGFKVGGTFSYIFSNYDIDPELDKSFFTDEEFKMEEDATKTDSAFWSDVRPVPLTTEEKSDYIKKDSLRKVWESKSYMDSLDRKSNKFSLASFLFGYSYDQSYKRRYWTVSSPLNTYQFNTVEGHRLGTKIGFTTYDSTNTHRFHTSLKIGYGFSDKKLKTDLYVSYRSNRIHQEYWSIFAGDSYKQLFNSNPEMEILNTFSGLIYKENNIRLYRSRYGNFRYQRELVNGLYFWGTLGFEKRSQLLNTSDFSFFNKDKVYAENLPPDYFPGANYADENHGFFSLQFRWRPGQKYASYPTYRVRERGPLPTFHLKYTKGLAFLGDTNYDKLSINIIDNRISMREYGYGKVRVSGGTFLSNRSSGFVDWNHFFANVHTVANLDNYMSLYKLMPHYEFSSANDYFTVHYEHHFDGYIMDKVPLLKNLGAKFVLGANTLQMKNRPEYYEASIGIDKLKIGLLSVFRMDYSWSFSNGGLLDHGFFVGVSTSIGG